MDRDRKEEKVMLQVWCRTKEIAVNELDPVHCVRPARRSVCAGNVQFTGDSELLER